MEIKPFRAFRFNKAVVGDVSRCIAPPYDVINPAQQQQLYEKSEYNIVRITKPIFAAKASHSDNHYTQAAELFKSWLDTGALAQDIAEAIYAYVQDFQLGGADFRRLTFIALAKLEDFGSIVRPHERILDEPIADRLNLTRATKSQFGLVFMLYEDPQGIADRAVQKASQQSPLIDYLDDDAVHHRLFAITSKEDLNAIIDMMRDKNCIIADGHHRYTTGLLYAKENGNPAAKYQMLAFCNTHHDGLIVLATHRLVSALENFEPAKLFAGLKGDFNITEYPFDSEKTKQAAKKQMLARMKTEHQKDHNAFGIYAATSAFYVAVLADTSAMDSAAPDMSRPWRTLDVTVLQKLILEKLLGIGDDKLAGGKYVEYVKDGNNKVEELVEMLDTGAKQVVFFMNPPKISQIRLVAEHGERMPQKSTYFYPKVFSGLTIHRI